MAGIRRPTGTERASAADGFGVALTAAGGDAKVGAAAGSVSVFWWPNRPTLRNPAPVGSSTMAAAHQRLELRRLTLNWRLVSAGGVVHVIHPRPTRCLSCVSGSYTRRRRRMAGTIAAPAKSRARPPKPIRGLSPEVEAPPAPVLGAPTGTTPVMLALGVTAAEAADTTEVPAELAAVTVNV